ncbi:MAG: M23 family metallopeptidase [Paludibacteraceae bacterium]|nr:M23 family metallopeptidase [Paludibacteraceae bacterium]
MSNKRRKYRLAMLDDTTLREVFHFRVSMLGAISVMTVAFLLLVGLLSALIVYTPIRNILPGYSASLRQQLIEESARVDSLQGSLSVQRQYLEDIKRMVAGELETDSVQSLDSLQRVERAQIVMTQSSEVTEAFLAQYEQKERDRLTLFDNTAARTLRRLQRPVRGVIVSSANPDQRQYAVTVKTAKNEPVLATTRGTIVTIERMIDNTFAITLQHGSFVTVYRHVTQSFKAQGATVEAGESLGQMNGQTPLTIELWDAGQFVNPEEVIVW